MTLAPKPYYWPNTRTLSYGDSPPIATRAGWMSLACMPFVLYGTPDLFFLRVCSHIDMNQCNRRKGQYDHPRDGCLA